MKRIFRCREHFWLGLQTEPDEKILDERSTGLGFLSSVDPFRQGCIAQAAQLLEKGLVQR